MKNSKTPSNTPFLCTRPALVSRLMASGFTPELVPNPWHPEQSAWEVPINDESCAAVAEFYREAGKPVPRCIREFMEGGAEDA